MREILFISLFITFFLPNTAQAQYFPFGQNRVQYEDFEWRIIKSKHFDVYYYSEQNYKLAEFAAMSIESAYKQIAEDFEHEIFDRIPLIIYDSHNDFSQTNVVPLPVSAEGIGGVTDKMKNRMTVPFMGDYADFRRTLHHELVHAVFNDMFYGGTIQSIVQNNIQLSFPLWFEEGLAEYSALGWDSNTDMFIRDAVINNYLPPIPYLSGYYAYRGGQSMWNFIVEEYGREKIGEILQRIKTSRSVEFGMSASLGYSLEELSNKWMEALKKRYYPEVAERENSKTIATLLTKRNLFGTYNTSPAISPQGDKVALITNKRGYFDIVVISAIDGRKLKTLIKGEDNPEFEELNILKPNLTWSPDGRKVALSTKSKGRHDIAIIDYETKAVQKIKFRDIDAIGSVAWSPNGRYIAFDGNVGPYQDIFVYDFDTQKLIDVTQDIFSDREPAWSSDSQYIYFISDRGSKTKLGEFSVKENLLLQESIYQTDIYKVQLGSNQAVQLTNTPWSETQPNETLDGRLVFLSDENGIQNIYELDQATRTATPLTNLQSGASQLSISPDGSRAAFSSINEGYIDVFVLRSPFDRRIEEGLKPNYWATRRASETEGQRVPATSYAIDMYGSGLLSIDEIERIQEEEKEISEEVIVQEEGVIDFRNYVFAEDVIQDSTLFLKDIDTFDIRDNITDDGRFIPEEYRLKFDLDIAYSPTLVASTQGSSAIAQFLISDLLGDHQLALGSNFVFDLRDSDYSIQYGYFKRRTNVLFSYYHSARNYQSYYGELMRYRTYGLGATIQYPFDKFKRLDLSLSMIGVARDYNRVYTYFSPNFMPVTSSDNPNETSQFFYPGLVYTNDRTLPGILTPAGGTRYSVGISGSPAISSTSPQFISLLGDFRKYFNMGYNYSIALRYSGGISFGKDAQNYFMGGKLGWINQKWEQIGLSFDRLADTIFTVPALPLRGYKYNAITGNNFSLINAEFRFPLFAAIVPGAVPILPLYNITGVAFLDVGSAWGKSVDYGLFDINGNPIKRDAGLDFRMGKEKTGYVPIQGGNPIPVSYIEGDILMGAGFGLRTIAFGLPIGYDVGWAYDRNGFKKKAMHYFTIGIDF